MRLRDEIMALPEGDRLAAALDYLEAVTGQAEARIVALQARFGLTRTEAAVLSVLDARAGRVVSREAIFLAVWGEAEVDMKIVDVVLCKLRRRLPEGTVRTAWGRGWSLDVPLDAAAGVSAGGQVAA